MNTEQQSDEDTINARLYAAIEHADPALATDTNASVLAPEAKPKGSHPRWWRSG